MYFNFVSTLLIMLIFPYHWKVTNHVLVFHAPAGPQLYSDTPLHRCVPAGKIMMQRIPLCNVYILHLTLILITTDSCYNTWLTNLKNGVVGCAPTNILQSMRKMNDNGRLNRLLWICWNFESWEASLESNLEASK